MSRDSAAKCEGPRAAAAREECGGDPTQEGPLKLGAQQTFPPSFPFGMGTRGAPRKGKEGAGFIASLFFQGLRYFTESHSIPSSLRGRKFLLLMGMES